MTGYVDVKFDGPVAIVTIARGRNEINTEFVGQINSALDKVLRYRPTSINML